MQKTVRQVLLSWIKSQSEFRNSAIETELPDYGYQRFGVLHSPGTYSRIWRYMREDRDLEKINLELADVSDNYPDRREKTWKIVYPKQMDFDFA
jgi:hypothetical protein